jgi:hypothetical protein
MSYLGKITNHHLVVTESEQLAIVNSLVFFNAIFDPKRVDSISELIEYWQPVADDTDINGVDELATRVACVE